MSFISRKLNVKNSAWYILLCTLDCQEYANRTAKLEEELIESHDEVLNLNRVVAESNGKINRLNADIDGLKTAKEVRD